MIDEKTADSPNLEDRVAMIERPAGWPVMYQSWGDLLFMHWRVPVEMLRSHVPERLEIDTFDGSAWIAVTPLSLWNVRPIFVPPVPFVSAFYELNVRTYVHLDGVPGVWFFSLDANSFPAVMGARLFYYLPYYNAAITLEKSGRTIDFKVLRTDSPSGTLAAKWTVGDRQPRSEPGSLEFFLTERYCLYAQHAKQIYRCRIHHERWPLRSAVLNSFSTTLFEANGLPVPEGEPMVNAAGPVHVEVWPLTAV
jgi:uncharacterized protein